MRLTRATSVTMGLSVVLLAGALVAPSAVGAAVPAGTAAAETPTSAFVRVDGGTAYAKKVGRHRYTVRLPKGVGIRWMGEAGGKPDQFGSFTPANLANSWQRIGHRKGVGVQSTITWRTPGTDFTDFTSALVSNPRINDKGQLVFSARTVHGSLPKVLPNFSFNISPAAPKARYPITWGRYQVTNQLAYVPKATADYAGNIVWYYLSMPSNNWVPCSNVPTVYVSGTTAINVPYGPFTCNGVSVLAGSKTYVSWKPTTGPSSPWSQMLACYQFQISPAPPMDACSTNAAMWQLGGTTASPKPISYV